MKMHLPIAFALFAATFTAFAVAEADSIVKPFNFTPNTLAMPNQVNDNFDTLYDQVNTIGEHITIDSSNNMVGIVSTTPVYTLDIGGDLHFSGNMYQDGVLLVGSSSPWSESGLDIYYDSERVGIGTSTPTSSLDVSGTVQATSFVGNGTGLSGIVSLETDPTGNALTKAILSCAPGQTVQWDGAAWNCADDKDIDTDTQLTEAQVDLFVANNGFISSFSETDPTVTTLAKETLPCTVGQVPKWNATNWACADDVAGAGAFVDHGTSASYSNGNVGIGISSPAQQMHVNGALRLEPASGGPYAAALGDIYYDVSHALCVHMATGWVKLAGTGTCTSPL